MKPRHLLTPPASTGRPRAVVLSVDQQRALAKLYLATNATRTAGSMETAWVLFTESAAGAEHAWTVAHRRLKSSRLPAAALDCMRRARALVGAARGGAPRLRSEGPYVAGAMRINHAEGRRLMAGERYSVDDLTRNVPCWIPWPWGGCKTSNNFHCKVGRWQTLAVLDDASDALIAVKSVFRQEQSYRGSDAASLVFQVEREIGMRGFGPGEGHWVVEGGVWQSAQMLAALAGRFISAKGRPNQKLIERWFGSMQIRDSVHLGDLGRWRGEILEENKLYLACRDGREDPRRHFLSLEAGQTSLHETIEWLNTRETRSRKYGRWVPIERWEADTAAAPLVTRPAQDAWVMSPERRRLKVTRKAMLSCQATGPHGVVMPMHFSAPWLWEHAGRTLDLYFDPLAEWPVTGHVADPRNGRLLGTVTCQAAFGMSRDADAEMAAAIRRSMMSELRCIVGSRTSLAEVRGPAGVATIERRQPAAAGEPLTPSRRSEADHLADRVPARDHGADPVLDPRHPTVAAGYPSPDVGRLAADLGGSRGGALPLPPSPGDRSPAAPSRTLGLRAAAAERLLPNF